MSTPTRPSSSSKRPPLKWPPPQTPKILNFPRRSHRKQKPTSENTPGILRRRHRTKKLESLFNQDRNFSHSNSIVLLHSSNSRNGCQKREKVAEIFDRDNDFEDDGGGGGDDGGGSGGEVLERERREGVVEVEMLRAECKFLRFEREFALKKVEQNRVWIKRILRSAVHILISGKEKMRKGNSGAEVFEEEIEELAEKLMMLQRSSMLKEFDSRDDCSNFDKQVSALQRRLEKLGVDKEASGSIHASSRADESSGSNLHCSKFKFKEMEVLRNQMQGLSKGTLLDRMKEEYGSLISTADNSAASSASNSRRMEYPPSLREHHKENMPYEEREGVCSGRCKVIVRRIVEQVRAETEQWSQMQEMLVQVKEEMEELQASKNFWEAQAIESTSHIQSLSSSVHEWEQKALASESKANELQAQIYLLQAEREKTKTEKNRQVQPPRTKKLSSLSSLNGHNENEKCVLICRLKENHNFSTNNDQKEALRDGARRKRVQTNSSRGNGLTAPKHSPFRDIGNKSSPVVKQISKTIFPVHCHQWGDQM